MSMCNDIVWKKKDDNSISQAEEVRNYAMKFLPGHWTFLGPGSEEKWCGDSHDQKGQWNCTANTKWYSDSKRQVILSSKVPVH